jgi:hypothetical protein
VTTVLYLGLLWLGTLTAPQAPDAFAFFQPTIRLTAADRRDLGRGEPIAHVVPAEADQVAVFAAVPVDITGDRFVSWMRRIEELKKSPYVLAIGRFSDPPRIEDLAGLSLDDDELVDVLDCRPGRCNLKLSSAEIAALQRVAAAAGADWRTHVQQAFRAAVLQRVTAYLTEGHTRIGPYADASRDVWPAARFSAVLGHSVFLTRQLPRLAEYLSRYPRTAVPEIESFLYWSKERLTSKSIVSVTHVSIVRSSDPALPDTLVAGKGVFATHYVNASLGITALLRGESGSRAYLAYVNRSEVDMLGGVFGGVVRWFLQRRLKNEAAGVLIGLRQRLESGDPPPRRTDGSRRATGR